MSLRLLLRAAALAPLILGAGSALAAETRRVSVTSGGEEANGASQKASISSDGRYVAFSSLATNLVSGDTNGVFDVFVRDEDTGQVDRVSVGRAGVEGNDSSYRPAISADGRFVAFTSSATNLVEGDANGKADVFVHDRRTGRTERVSVAGGGGEADGASDYASISADGSRVVFQTDASNLFDGDANNLTDILLRDRAAGVTTLVSRNTAGKPGNGASVQPQISADGRFVSFSTTSSNIGRHSVGGGDNIVLRDLAEGTSECVTRRPAGLDRFCLDDLSGYHPSAISADGRFVAFQRPIEGDTGTSETYVSGIIVRDMKTGDETVVSRPASGDKPKFDSYRPSISADGRYVAYTSGASNLVSGDTNRKLDVFVTDRVTGAVTRASVGGKNRQSRSYSDLAAISGDGRFVVFSSEGSEFVPGDANGAFDIFLRDLDAEPGRQADMRVETRAQPRRVALGERATFSFVVTNAGPDAAAKASFSLQIENGAARKVTVKGGDCAALAGLVTCSLGRLAPRKSVVVKAEIVARGTPFRQSARVQAAPADPEKSDNSLSFVTKVSKR